MAKVVVSPQAEADLTEIQNWILARAGDAIAANFIQRLLASVRTISIVPHAAGHPVPQLGEDLRCHPVASYNIYLRYDPSIDVLYVVRVLRGRRRITRRNFTGQL